MTDLARFQARKDAVLSIYDEILEDDSRITLLFPRSKKGIVLGRDPRHELTDRRAKLRSERFLVAVAGVVNVGKSTLLNALIFGDDVLAMSAVPMTATITEITHGTNEELSVTFFDAGEWNALNEAYQKNQEQASAWEALLAHAQAAGASETELVQTPALVHSHMGLTALKDYTATPENGGLYSPYVSSIRVTAPMRWGQAVGYVDTPGTLDPNPVRATVTRDWIGRADAVLYVTNASQAGANASDLEFLARYVAHVPAERRFLVINRVDAVDHPHELLDQYERIKAEGGQDPQVKFLAASQGPFLVSAIAALDALKDLSGKAINPKRKERLVNAGLWGLDGSGLVALEHQLGRVLASSKGEALLHGEGVYFDSVCANALRHWRTEVVEIDEQIAAATLDVDVLKRAQTDARQSLQKLKGAVRDLKDELDKTTAEFKPGGTAHKEFCKKFEKWADQAHSEVGNENKPRVWRSRYVLSFMTIFEANSDDLIAGLIERLEGDSGRLELIFRNVETQLMQSTDFDLPVRHVTVPSGMVRALVKDLDAKFEITQKRWYPVWGNLLGDLLTWDKREYVKGLRDQVRREIIQEAKKVMANFQKSFKRSLLKSVSQLESELNRRLETRIDMIDRELETASDSRADKVARLSAERNHAEDQIAQVERLSLAWQRAWS